MSNRTWTGRVFIGVSLDGMIARSDGDIDWLTDPPAGRAHVPGHTGPAAPENYDEFMAATDHIVMGRGTYEKVRTFGEWPYHNKRVVILSTTLPTDNPVGASVVADVDEACRVLEEQGAVSVYVDGGQVVQAFLRAGLIDDMIISTAPVLIGEGLPLFGSLPSDILLTHLGTSYSGTGMTSSRYAVDHPRCQ